MAFPRPAAPQTGAERASGRIGAERWNNIILPLIIAQKEREGNCGEREGPGDARALFRYSAATYSPTRLTGSTIGSAGLNFRVREGNG